MLFIVTAIDKDNSLALRMATREARALLGDPQPRDSTAMDLDAVLQAAVGDSRHLFEVDP